MYKNITLLLCALLLVACGGGGGGSEDTSQNNTGASIEVNLLGDWDYSYLYENSVCGSSVVSGVITINPLNGDLSKIGSVIAVGDQLDINTNGSCIIVPTNEVNVDDQGRAATQTPEIWLSYADEDNKGDNTIEKTELVSFTENKIVKKNYYTNGVISDLTLVRINNTLPSVSVNLLGDWNYSYSYENSVCDSYIAKGILTVNADIVLSKIGSIYTIGETIEFGSFNSCSIGSFDNLDASSQGQEATQAPELWLKYSDEANKNDTTIIKTELTTFSDNKIIEKTYFSNGVNVEVQYTR